MINNSAMILNLWGYQLNLMTVMIISMIVGMIYLFVKIQTSGKLDFADMFTKDGRKVSATKVLQFFGGLTATWVIVKMGLQGTLTAEILGVYLAYTASIEGFSKFISAKYNYTETSVKDATPPPEVQENPPADDSLLHATAAVNAAGDGPVQSTIVTNLNGDGTVASVEKTIKKG